MVARQMVDVWAVYAVAQAGGRWCVRV